MHGNGDGTEPRRPEGVSARAFLWETRDLSPLHRSAVAAWSRLRRPAAGAALGVVVFLLGAAVTAGPGPGNSGLFLQERLRHAEQALVAREGELELARLELKRLAAIVDYSRTHRIPADLATAIYDIALAEGIEPAVAFSLVRVESGFTRRAVSSAGAVGLTQVMPSTAFWLQPGLRYDDLFERDTNLRLGFRYLRMMVEQYGGDLHLALLAYNRGPGRVDTILRTGGDPSNGYSSLVRRGAGATANAPAGRSERRPAVSGRVF
jgi:soluble lytic murein transglycosylase-like protein